MVVFKKRNKAFELFKEIGETEKKIANERYNEGVLKRIYHHTQTDFEVPESFFEDYYVKPEEKQEIEVIGKLGNLYNSI